MGNDDNNIPEAMVRGEEEEEEESEEEYHEAGGSQEASGSQKATGSKAKAAETNKYPCIKCQKSVVKAGVRCNTCHLWVHNKCQKISKELYAILGNPGRFGGAVTWNCDSCVASALRLDKRMTALESRFQEVEDWVVRNEVAVLEVDKRMDKVEQRQDKVEEMMNNERERLRKERVEEMRERKLRKKNVIMHRIEEAGDWAGTEEERREWDLKSIENIFGALKLGMNRRAVRFSRRVGEKGEEPRPMVVGLCRESQKEELLDSVRELRNTPFDTVGIVPDLTREQRKDEADMAKEAEKRNGNLTEDDRTKNLVWMAIGRRGEKRLVKGVQRVREVNHRGGEIQRRGGAGPHQRGGGAGRLLLPPPENRRQWTAAGGREGTGEREQLIELVRGGMTGDRNMRNNSKRNREGEGSDEERIPPTQPQPHQGVM